MSNTAGSLPIVAGSHKRTANRERERPTNREPERTGNREPGTGNTNAAGLRRAEICRTAAQMIRERGYDATSVNDIARALGITKAGLYHYISGKEALLFEIMTFGMDQVEAEVVIPAQGITDPEERLRQLVTRHARIIVRAQGAVAYLAEEVRRLPVTERTLVERRMRAYFDLVRGTIEALQATGKMRDVDPTVAAFSILGMIHWLPRWYQPSGRLSEEHLSEQLASLALGGLLQPGTRVPRARHRLSRAR